MSSVHVVEVEIKLNFVEPEAPGFVPCLQMTQELPCLADILRPCPLFGQEGFRDAVAHQLLHPLDAATIHAAA